MDDVTAPFVRFFPLNEARNRVTRKQRLNVAGLDVRTLGEAEGSKHNAEGRKER